jgi:hypothetical protein
MSYGRVITERSFQRDFRPDLLTKAMEVNGSDWKSAKLIMKIDRNPIKLNGIDFFFCGLKVVQNPLIYSYYEWCIYNADNQIVMKLTSAGCNIGPCC